MNTTPKYVGIITMGPNYSDPYWETDAYVWDTLADVRASLASVRRGRGVAARVAEWEDDGSARAGALDDSFTPCADTVRAYILRNETGVLDLAETDGLVMATMVR